MIARYIFGVGLRWESLVKSALYVVFGTSGKSSCWGLSPCVRASSVHSKGAKEQQAGASIADFVLEKFASNMKRMSAEAAFRQFDAERARP